MRKNLFRNLKSPEFPQLTELLLPSPPRSVVRPTEPDSTLKRQLTGLLVLPDSLARLTGLLVLLNLIAPETLLRASVATPGLLLRAIAGCSSEPLPCQKEYVKETSPAHLSRPMAA